MFIVIAMRKQVKKKTKKSVKRKTGRSKRNNKKDIDFFLNQATNASNKEEALNLYFKALSVLDYSEIEQGKEDLFLDITSRIIEIKKQI